MTRAWAALREGTWLTPARRQGYAVLLIVLYATLVLAVLATAHGTLDATGRANAAGIFAQIASPALTDSRHRIAPTDVSAFWAALRLPASGRPQAAYDWRAALVVVRSATSPA